jgi:hypothetical protein
MPMSEEKREEGGRQRRTQCKRVEGCACGVDAIDQCHERYYRPCTDAHAHAATMGGEGEYVTV